MCLKCGIARSGMVRRSADLIRQPDVLRKIWKLPTYHNAVFLSYENYLESWTYDYWSCEGMGTKNDGSDVTDMHYRLM